MLKKLATVLLSTLLIFLPMAGVASAAITTNPIANPSVENGTTTPDGWTSGSWTTIAGAITPTFDYVTNDGHGDSRSVKVTMANYDTGDDGDAKWYFNPISTSVLEVGQQYRLNAWYKASAGVVPKAVVMYTMADGTEQFFGMPNPQPAANSDTTWTRYSDTFSVPQGVASVSTFFYLNQNGWIQTDDYSIEDYTPTGWSAPLLTLTFDDGHEDNVNNALPLLTQYGLKSTQCFETQDIINNPTQAQSNVLAFYNAGHEICSHTITHPMLTQVSDAQLTQELTESKSYLEGIIGHPVPDFASPFGDYNAHVNAAIKAAGYDSHRTVDEGYNSKDNFDPYRLRVQNIFNTTTASQVAAWVAQAKADNTWLIFVYHRVVDTSQAGQPGYEAPEQYDTSVDLFTQHLQAIQASGINVKTYHDALADVKAQLDGGTPADTTPPTLGDVVAGAITDTSATINFGTLAEPTSGSVEYGTTTAYGTTVNDTAVSPDHHIALSGLAPNTTYYFKVHAADTAGNAASEAGSFTTRPAVGQPDTTAPIISLLNVAASGTGAFISWNTDELATSSFEYGTTTAYGTTVSGTSTQTHFVSLSNLTPGLQYFFKVTATDQSGNASTYLGNFTPVVSANPGDINGDTFVNDDDATILFAHWGPAPAGSTNVPGDLDHNGVVDDDDATILFANWSL